ncbi:hypothetical protein HY638_05570 [Candidatus Woesearchaeota archaeon]|nr:hypothetical protein [Candidatus Woesearchaeota archaeon]
MKKKAKDDYIAGKISLSKAAKIANLTVWEMQSLASFKVSAQAYSQFLP